MNATAPRSSFVTATAWISLALGIMGAASGLVQAVALPAFDPDSMLRTLGGGDVALPPSLRWMFAHMQLLNFLSLLSSALFAWVSWGLLQRREWARRGFIAFLAAGAIGAFAGMALTWHMLDWVAVQSPPNADAADLFAQMRALVQATLLVCAVLAALLHGAIVWKLCTPAIRAEFSAGK